MDAALIVAVALGLLGFGLVSGRLERTSISAPMIFTALGILIGARGLGLVGDVQSESLHRLGEITLVLVLFIDAARIDLRRLAREQNLPVRMLAIGLPLTILLGAVLARGIFAGTSWWVALALATILAPTDAALGQSVVSNLRVPVRIRQTLNVESGLNDGIALPILLMFFAFVVQGAGNEAAIHWAGVLGRHLLLGSAFGFAVGWIGGRLVTLAAKSGWINGAFERISALSLALLAWGGAEALGANGFVAAFWAGIAVGNFSRAICACLFEFAEAEIQLLTALVFMAFGAVMVPAALSELTWHCVLYAVLSLTVIRMVPMALSLVGAHLLPRSILFLAWFGPRGIASILYVYLALEHDNPGFEFMFGVVTFTVLLSVFLHGMTAYPASVRYGKWIEEHERGHAERKQVPEMPLRVPRRHSG